jgi:hypothetical protein
VVILVIDKHGVFTVEKESQPPIAADPDSPMTSQIGGQEMLKITILAFFCRVSPSPEEHAISQRFPRLLG